jgi:hypothetical protein
MPVHPLAEHGFLSDNGRFFWFVAVAKRNLGAFKSTFLLFYQRPSRAGDVLSAASYQRCHECAQFEQVCTSLKYYDLQLPVVFTCDPADNASERGNFAPQNMKVYWAGFEVHASADI